MTEISDGGDLRQLNEFLSQRKMKSLFHLIDTTGPSHCPLFTMRLSICDQTGKKRNLPYYLKVKFIYFDLYSTEIIISQTIGTGRTKKLAKRAAAKHYLQSFFNTSEQIESGTNVIDHAFIQLKSEAKLQTDVEQNVLG